MYLNMNTTELVNAVTIQTELSEKNVAKVVNELLVTISASLAKEKKVHMLGFGTFKAHEFIN